MSELTKTEKELLKKITDKEEFKDGAFNIRENGKGIMRKTTENIDIITKTDKPGIDIKVKENTKNEFVHIPVMITESGVNDLVYNDFYIGKNAEVTIIAGCGIHNDQHLLSRHDGIHTFYLDEGAKVKYVEKHYGEGEGTGESGQEDNLPDWMSFTIDPETGYRVDPSNGNYLDAETGELINKTVDAIPAGMG